MSKFSFIVPVDLPDNLSVKEMAELENDLLIEVDTCVGQFTNHPEYNSDMIEEFADCKRGLYPLS